MPSRIQALISAAICLLQAAVPSAPAVAADVEIDPSAYPELAAETTLPLIIAELRHTLPDIYSLCEVKLCPARRIKLKDGRPVDWAIPFEFNAKNEAGGYAGIRRDVAIFRNGRIAYPIGASAQLGRTGLDGIMSKAVDKQIAGCTAIPDSKIQVLLAVAK